jgi:hypothetical protein
MAISAMARNRIKSSPVCCGSLSADSSKPAPAYGGGSMLHDAASFVFPPLPVDGFVRLLSTWWTTVST